jgi:hypothetical protein
VDETDIVGKRSVIIPFPVPFTLGRSVVPHGGLEHKSFAGIINVDNNHIS